MLDTKAESGDRMSASEFIAGRMEVREKLEEWGYIWAHRLLEDVYIRPNFDIQAVISMFRETLLEGGPESEDSLKRLEELKNQIGAKHGQKPKSLLVKDGAGTMLMVGRKLLWHIHIVGLAIAFVDVFLESKKYKKIEMTMDRKVEAAKAELRSQMFEMRLTDLKTKFLAIKNAFKLVVEGNDDETVRRSRLDSVFLLCEEI